MSIILDFFETDIFKIIKAIVEFIYLLSAPLLVFLAYKGLEQIKVAKNQSKINSKREAYRVTAEQCKYYLDVIISLFNEMHQKEQEENVKFFKHSIIHIHEEQISVEFPKDDDLEKIDIVVLKLANALEGFAFFFVTGLGDEKIAYETIGWTFTNSIKGFLPFLIRFNNNGKSFSSTLKLFHIWNSRMEKEDLELKKQNLDKKINSKNTINLKHIGEE